MADLEEGQVQEDLKEPTEQAAPEGEVEGASPPATPEAKAPEATPAEKQAEPGEQQAAPSEDELPLDALLRREDVKRTIQSAADRAYEKAKKRFSEEAERQARELDVERENTERRRLIEEGDYETLGRQEATKAQQQERVYESLRQAGSVISQATAERYNETLGEEVVDEIIKEVGGRDGNIVDLNLALAKAERERAVSQAVKEATTGFETKMRSELDALRAELGSQRRSEVGAQGSEKISGAPAETRTPTEELTYEKASAAYGTGDLSWAEFKPILDEHNRERSR